MQTPKIIELGRGPTIEGTRITVFDVLYYMKAGRSRDYIATMLGLSSLQVKLAQDYIEAHQSEIDVAYAKNDARVRQGNPAWVEERLKQNRARFDAFVAQCQEEKQHAGHNGGS
jgi:uncharacterized protein (DUF433 family)